MKHVTLPAAFVLCVAVAVGLAQSPLGTITGVVSDAQQARVPNAEVVATNVSTNVSFRAITGEDGTYTIVNLPVGTYEVTAQAPGFKQFRRTGVVVEVAQRLRLDLTLELGALTETVTSPGRFRASRWNSRVWEPSSNASESRSCL